MDRLFLDANVLFSTAYREDAGVARLWSLGNAALVTSDYAIEEARRNLADEDQIERLNALVTRLEVTAARTLATSLRGDIDLPEQDWPIVGGAVGAGATHLITGDVKHFGPHFGKKLLGVLVLSPAGYLRAPGRPSG